MFIIKEQAEIFFKIRFYYLDSSIKFGIFEEFSKNNTYENKNKRNRQSYRFLTGHFTLHPAPLYAELLQRIQKRGYNTDKLIIVPQD